jgi:outer membrane receptor protein involved in Fe transport
MPKSMITRSALAAALCALSLCADALADSSKRVIDIPPGDLAVALDLLAKQAGADLVYRPEQVRGLKTAGVAGEFSALEAFTRLLQGTPLKVSMDSTGALLIAAPLPAESQVSETARSNLSSSTQAARSDARRLRLAQADTNESAGSSSGDGERRAEVEEIVVTGTNIAGVVPAGSPVLVIDSIQIRQSGYSSTEQLLQALPQNFRGGQAGASADVNFSSGTLRATNWTAGSGVNLRGLGSNATLVLINGRRIAATGSGAYTDISLIPVDAIERIEILTDGASAIYGADAVAGVINIILKQDHQGAESRVRYGFTTEGGRDEYRLSQMLGGGWDGGGATLSASYLDQSQLLSSERAATANAVDPSSLFPANELASVSLVASHRFMDEWTIQSDAQYSRSDRHLIDSDSLLRSDSFIDLDRYAAAVSLSRDAFGDWTFSLDGSVSQEDTDIYATMTDQATGALTRAQNQVQTQDQWNTELRGSGSLFALPGGAVKLALGASYREEEFFRRITSSAEAGRNVTSAFIELHVPLVGEPNAVRGIRSLKLSLAGRYDDYSDFGSSTNPKVGIAWSPIEDVTLRSSYSTSFRAPATGQELDRSEGGVGLVEVLPFFAPDGDGFVPVALLFGSDRLQPEESTNWTAGLTWKPGFAPGLGVDLTWYDISYTDRIVVPPFDFGALTEPALQAFVDYFETPAEVAQVVNSYLAQGAFFSDSTDGLFGPDPLSQTTVVYRYLWTNAESVDVSGLDLTADYRFERGENRYGLALNINYIQEMVNVPAPGAQAYDLIDTYGNPPDLRFRASISWSRGGFAGALNVNHTDSYTNTAALVDQAVDSYTTVDMTTRYTFSGGGFADGLSISLFATNLFDKEPPFLELPGLGGNYDAANADPLGRMVGIEVAKRWSP